MKLLLVDIGNTTADFRAYDPKTETLTPLIRPLSQDHILSDTDTIVATLKDFHMEFSAIVYVSVVPGLNDLIRAIGHHFEIPVYSLRHDLPVDWSVFKLNNVHLLGADFVANYYGVKATYPCHNYAVVALGTATTIFVVQNHEFLGTTISPGIQSSLKGLFSQAALLSEMNYEAQEGVLGFNTLESIGIGTINGHYYMIEGLLREIKTQYQIDNVILTGGNMYHYAQLENKQSFIFDETLIFKGLVYLYEQKIASEKSDQPEIQTH